MLTLWMWWSSPDVGCPTWLSTSSLIGPSDGSTHTSPTGKQTEHRSEGAISHQSRKQWVLTSLFYSILRIENYTPDLPRADVDSAMEKAFRLWSNVSPLTFTKIFEGQADIMISFVWGGKLFLSHRSILTLSSIAPKALHLCIWKNLFKGVLML